ncbi:ATP-binding protein [Zhongshania sp. BJYM1]|uniref:ATP-binding protein n=1 Tax=Zhongshania aquatica TaxID=2965069 RepID=UPI0022B573D6|nr:ATP-binding protein [Marortus sp. BJYM1]
MNRILPDTLKARTILLLTLVFIVSHTLSLMIYKANRDESVLLTEASDLAQRILGIVDLAYTFPAEQRQKILTAAETQLLTSYPDLVPLDVVACQQNALSVEISDRIFQIFQQRPAYQIDVCVRRFDGGQDLRYPRSERAVDLLVNIHFPDNETASFHAELPGASSLLFEAATLHLLLVIVLALLITWYLISKLISPIDKLASAAEHIGMNIDVEPLEEAGAKEIRVAARAFNEMQGRLRRLLHGQTEMFAAISHDLKSAVTRLQLRCDLLVDEKEREGLQRVVQDMRNMIASIVDFVRGDNVDEPIRRISIGDLLESLCEDLIEESAPVEYRMDQTAYLDCRPAQFKRAVQNLIENACKHAGSAFVHLQVHQAGVSIVIEDNGVGIPENQLEDVIRPFVTVDQSRSRSAGGMGLGLAITQKIIHSHGGTLTLRNKPSGGLLVELWCPFSVT